jgi:hypothetical protein
MALKASAIPLRASQWSALSTLAHAIEFDKSKFAGILSELQSKYVEEIKPKAPEKGLQFRQNSCKLALIKLNSMRQSTSGSTSELVVLGVFD